MSELDRRIPEYLEALSQLVELPAPERIAPARQIYVNRDLRMDRIEMIGFDLDYTLATYARPHLEETAFRLTAEELVRDRGYPADLLAAPYDPSFCIRGLVVDKKLGNLLKMDRYRHVGRAYQGRQPLTKEERRSLYRGVQIRLGLARYHLIDTLFALPEVALFAEVVERTRRAWTDAPSYETIFADIRETIDLVHRDGALKSRVLADLPGFLALDPELPLALHKFRSSGKRLFLLTNSLWDYSDQVMGFLLSGRLAEYPSWRNFFDVVVVGADKPAFFTERRPFVMLDGRGKPAAYACSRFDRLRVYQGGNLVDFEAMSDTGGDRILYVGDHLYGDILRSKKHSAWRTAMIIEELEQEMASLGERSSELQRIHELEARCRELDIELNYLQSVQKALQRTQERNELTSPDEEAVEGARRRTKAESERVRREIRGALDELEVLEEQCHQAFNRTWGMLFREGLETSRFGDQVQDYACVYTSRVSNFLFCSPMQYFRSSRHHLPHERG
jgi:HAD superfamily 5'-nucleotidase-like hydrolase